MEYSEVALQRVREDRLLIDEVDQWLYEEIAPYLGRRVLEMGCGLGNFARHLTGRELYVGTDVSAESVNHVQELYRERANMRAFLADAAGEAVLSLAHFEFDTVFSLNVFEHIEDDRKALRNAWQLLQPGGMMILVVPAHSWLYGSIDRAIGHYRRYDKRSTAVSFAEAGFSVVEQKYLNALGAMGWLVNGRFLNHDVPPSGQLKVFNRIVPLLKRMERLFPPPFGISLLTVGRK